MVTDMNGTEIKVGAKVNRYSLIGRKTGEPKVRTVDALAALNGEPMVWFEEGGGCHHPRACEVIPEAEAKKLKTTYFSNASWSKISDSSDSHNLKKTAEENLEYAQTICELLLRNWGAEGKPCDIRGTCLKTWVTDEDGKVIT